jgi:hypothetical protein
MKKEKKYDWNSFWINAPDDVDSDTYRQHGTQAKQACSYSIDEK